MPGSSRWRPSMVTRARPLWRWRRWDGWDALGRDMAELLGVSWNDSTKLRASCPLFPTREGTLISAFGRFYVSGRYRARTCDPQRVMLVR